MYRGPKGIALMLHGEHLAASFRQRGVLGLDFLPDLFNVIFQAGNPDFPVADVRVELFQQLGDDGVGVLLVEAL